MDIEITLDQKERRLLWMLAQVRDIQLRGLVQLQLIINEIDESENIVKHFVSNFYHSWVQKPKEIATTLDEFTKVGHLPILLSQEEKDRQEKAQEEHNACERRIYLLERLGLAEIYDEVENEFSHFKTRWVRITPEGESIVSRIEEGRLLIVRPRQIKRTSIFVASAFGREDTDQLLTTVIEPACSKLGYNPVRVDLSEPTTTITEAILRGIQEAELVIADLTYSRPSVYFESGFANGLGVPLILTCRKDHLKGTKDTQRVHFDLEQYKISFWHIAQDGSIKWSKDMDPGTRIQKLLKRKERKF